MYGTERSEAIREVLDDKEYEKLKHILEVTENQLNEVSSLLFKVDKQGVNQKAIREHQIDMNAFLSKFHVCNLSMEQLSYCNNVQRNL